MSFFKHIFLICLVLLAFRGQTQEASDGLAERLPILMKTRISWKHLSKQAESAEEKRQVTACISDSANAFCLDPRIDGDYIDDFHLLDLDGDHDLDIIYEGFECAGMSTKTVLVYLNQKGRLTRAWAGRGRIASVRTGSELVVYQYPCCSETLNTFISFLPGPDTLIRLGGLHFFYSPFFEGMELDRESIIPKKLKPGACYRADNGVAIYAPAELQIGSNMLSTTASGYMLSQASVKAFGSYTSPRGERRLFVLVPPSHLSVGVLHLEFPTLVWIDNDHVHAIKPDTK